MSEKPWVKTYAGGKPNYCTPEHEWVGLTDEEIKTIIFADDTELGVKTYSASDWWKIKRAEILLREKNVPQP